MPITGTHKAIGLAGILGLMLAGFQVWEHLRVEMDRVVQQREWQHQVDDRLCALEHGR